MDAGQFYFDMRLDKLQQTGGQMFRRNSSDWVDRTLRTRSREGTGWGAGGVGRSPDGWLKMEWKQERISEASGVEYQNCHGRGDDKHWFSEYM